MFTGFIKCDCNGVCIEVNPFICTTSTSTSSTTTTTTTAANNRWQYDYLSYTCTSCEIIEYSSLYNSNPLTLDNYYQYGDIVITPYALLGVDTGISDASIPDTGVATCEEINCFTTTTTTTRNLKVCKIVSMQALKVEGGSWSALDCLGEPVSGTIPFPDIIDTPCIEFGTLLLEDAEETGALDCGLTTTTTTLFSPIASPCVWSRDINVVGSIDVYDVASNTTVSISVPNDFATPTGITMQAFTNNKLWIGDGVNTIKEWDIMQETLSLSFVRDISISNFGPSDNQPSIIAAIDDTTILLGINRVNGGSANVGYWDITSPVSTITPNNSVATRPVNIANTFGVAQQLTGIIYTNLGNVIISCRHNFVSSTNNVGNFIIQYTGLPDPDFNIPWLPSIGTIRVQNTIDFTLGYTGRKAFDLFAWNGIVYLINPETSDLYEVSQTSQYDITLLESNLGYSDTQTFCSSTGCSNVNFVGYSPDCIPTSLPAVRSTNTGPYIGPVNFTYLGMTVQASSVVYQGTRLAGNANITYPCSGVSIGNTPTVIANGNIGSCSLDTPAFDYTLTFPSPVNNIPFRLAVLDGNDDFRFTTNGGTPTITANVNCNVDIIGNELYTIDGIFFGGGSGEFVITAPFDYTEITISGTNCGNGGPIWLGCQNDPAVTTTTTTLFPPTTTTTTTVAGVNTIFTYFTGVNP